MTDIEFHDLRNACNAADIAVVQAMTRVHDQAKFCTDPRGGNDALQLLLLRIALGIGVAAGVQFDDGRTGRYRSLELESVRINEQRNTYASLRQF